MRDFLVSPILLLALLCSACTKDFYASGIKLSTGEATEITYNSAVLPESDWVHYVETKSSANKTIVFTIDRNPASTSRETFVLLKPKEGNQARCLYIYQKGRS